MNQKVRNSVTMYMEAGNKAKRKSYEEKNLRWGLKKEYFLIPVQKPSELVSCLDLENPILV